MKNNFKGYTLVELLLSLAVFSIVMVIIGGVVSSTTAMYRNENFEVTMQEDASLVMAQIDELLLDATNFSQTSTSYKVTNSGKEYEIYSFGNKLFVKDGTNVEILSDCISNESDSFQIGGYSTTGANCDNAVLVSIDFDKSGYTYHAEKQVYFRNNLENRNVNVITTAIGGSGGGGGGTNTTPECNVKRYEVVDLDMLYGTEGGWSFKSSGGNYSKFVFCKDDGSDLGPSDSSYPRRYLKLVDATNTSDTDTVDKTEDIRIVNTNGKEVILTVEAVSFDYGTGVLILPAIKSNHGSLDAFEIKGLDLYWLTKRSSTKAKVSAVVYYDNDDNQTFKYDGSDKYNSNKCENHKVMDKVGGNNSDYDIQFNKTIQNYQVNSGGSIDYNGDIMQFNNNFVRVRVMGDQFGRGFALNYDQVQLKNNGKDTVMNDGKFRMLLRFEIPGSTKYYYVDYQIFCAGNNMSHKTGGKTYTKNKTSVGANDF